MRDVQVEGALEFLARHLIYTNSSHFLLRNATPPMSQVQFSVDGKIKLYSPYYQSIKKREEPWFSEKKINVYFS